MKDETRGVAEPTTSAPRKRSNSKRHSKSRKRAKPTLTYQGSKPKSMETKKMRRVLRRRVRDYNSDDEDENAEEEEEKSDDAVSDMDVEEEASGSSSEEDDGGESMEHGATKFSEGCRAFKAAFLKITKLKTAETDPLGPVLSAHKKLVVEKLAEELEDQKAKGEARKERRSVGEKGHVQPLKYLDSKEKFLVSVATKGVVRLFNAVNKAQHQQKKLGSSRLKDAKELAKRRKRTFLSELRKPTISNNSEDGTNNDEPGWAPLRDDYMLTNPKLKDWDKMEDPSFTRACT